MDTESFFLQMLQKTHITESLDDDCAWLSSLLYNDSKNTRIDKKNYIIAMDSFVENIHFRCAQDYNDKNMHNNVKNHTQFSFSYQNKNQWLSHKNLAKKAFLVNISDMLSSGALPKYALLSLCIPKKLPKHAISELIQGLEEICQTYAIKLIGGDTISGNELGFHITMIGKLQGKYLHRNMVRNGDFLAYTSKRKSNIGSSLKSLKEFLRYGTTFNKIPKNHLESNRHLRFIAPTLRTQFLLKAQRYLHACMDISDGLGNDIHCLEKLNNLNFHNFHNIQKSIYQSGEEYELLFTFPPKYLQTLKKIAIATRIKIHVIGQFGYYKKQNLHAIKWHK